MSKAIFTLTALLFFVSTYSQETPDTIIELGSVTVRAFEANRKRDMSVSPVDVITKPDRSSNTSLLIAMNTVPGVRMEERSPGSYRLNMRGSSLRSPFGVRNVKVYWNNIPFTDPGGNTYFNQFNATNFSSLEIVKGPASSMYGAGTGGLILLNPFNTMEQGIEVGIISGSFDMKNVYGTINYGTLKKSQLHFSHMESDGYRVQTKMRRDNVSWISQISTSDENSLTASILYSDLYYQTPGALTLNEFLANPKAARPAGGGFPSAVDAKAAIFQKNITAGFTNEHWFGNNIKNSTTLYGAFSQVKNSAIRNYERRNEPQFGGRTVFSWLKVTAKNELKLVGGAEYQQGFFNTQVAKNRNGNPDTIQTNDDIDTKAYYFFLQGDLSINEKWFINAGLSLNRSDISIRRLNVYPVKKQNRQYEAELAPRLAIMRKWNDFSWRALVSRGFSPPTVAEVLPSTGVISTDLEAEYGWNMESSVRKQFFKRKLAAELTAFYFKLNDALVQRRDISGADFFVNAGKVDQKGIEAKLEYNDYFNGFVRHIYANGAYSYSDFTYESFTRGNDDFTGKKVPSVPEHAFSLMTDIQFARGIYTNLTLYTASKIFLNDANTAVAEDYQLLSARVGFKIMMGGIKINLFAGADNLLDQQYSLGNDINAAANRFYNAAPRRNYYGGVILNWVSARNAFRLPFH